MPEYTHMNLPTEREKSKLIKCHWLAHITSCLVCLWISSAKSKNISFHLEIWQFFDIQITEVHLIASKFQLSKKKSIGRIKLHKNWSSFSWELATVRTYDFRNANVMLLLGKMPHSFNYNVIVVQHRRCDGRINRRLDIGPIEMECTFSHENGIKNWKDKKRASKNQKKKR